MVVFRPWHGPLSIRLTRLGANDLREWRIWHCAKFDLLLCRPASRGDDDGLQISVLSLRFWRRCLSAPAAKRAGRSLTPAGNLADGRRGDAKIRVQQMRRRNLRGSVVWLKDPINPANRKKPHIDDKNPNPTLAKRPIIGLALFQRACGPTARTNGSGSNLQRR